MTGDIPTHVFSVLTPDRPGITTTVTGIFNQQSVNIVDISQTVVHGCYTIIFGIQSDDPAQVDRIAQQVRTALDEPLSHVAVIPYRRPAPVDSDSNWYILTANGLDAVGIVHRITQACRNYDAEFTDLYSHVTDDRFTLIAEFHLPTRHPIAELQQRLAEVGAEVGLAVRVQNRRLFNATNDISFHA